MPEGCTGCVILDVLEDLILVCGVSLTRPDQVFIGPVNHAKIAEGPIEWKCLSRNNELPPDRSLATDLLYFKHQSDDTEYEVAYTNSIILRIKKCDFIIIF